MENKQKPTVKVECRKDADGDIVISFIDGDEKSVFRFNPEKGKLTTTNMTAMAYRAMLLATTTLVGDLGWEVELNINL